MNRVVGIGQACIDLLLEVDDSFLSHVGGQKGGAEPLEFDAMEALIKKSGKTPLLAAGGSCANTMRGLSSLGEQCAFLTHLGSDPLGMFFQTEMEKQGIEGHYQYSIQPTGRVLCLITPDGQRTMRYFIPFHPPLQPLEAFPNKKLIHHEAYSLQTSHFDLHPNNSLDLSSFEIVQSSHALLWQLIKSKVNILFGNSDEMHALTGCEPEEACMQIQGHCPIVIVLMGKDGCLVGSRGKTMHVPAYPAVAIDSTGAGDFFASGFLFGYLHGFALEKCARLGNRLGSAVVQVAGAQLPDDDWRAIREEFNMDKN
ncbi:MAG: adenosine kinase [Parachlamydia sp.]|jgi:sugar/nucleoside kinase (ribokinase family)|nr:adenosine kinase [Parachlamydia sp.]